MDDDELGAGSVYDSAGTGALLRWFSAAQERPVGAGSMPWHRWAGDPALVVVRLFNRVPQRRDVQGLVAPGQVGLVVPARIVYAQYSSVEAAYMGSLADSANHVLFYGIIGASIGWGLGIYLAVKRRTMTNETNLHGETTRSEHLANETPCDANMPQPQGGTPPGRAGRGKMVN